MPKSAYFFFFKQKTAYELRISDWSSDGCSSVLLVSGETITAIAMTEPGTGSDLQSIRTTAKKDGNHYVVSGSKTYITNGQNADLILVVAKTDPTAQPAYKGMSIILVETDREGFRRGRKLDKIGQDAADTSRSEEH